MRSEFKVRPNLTVGCFLAAFSISAVYTAFTSFSNNVVGSVGILVALLLILVYFLGCRPYKYVIEKKTIYTYRRLLKPKELDLMQCATITDLIVKITKWTSMPHVVEIYSDKNKKYAFFPYDRVGFTGAVLRENKRIHCTVKEYTDIHRKLAKKQRKERRNQREE